MGYEETKLPPAASGKFSAIGFASTGHKKRHCCYGSNTAAGVYLHAFQRVTNSVFLNLVAYVMEGKTGFPAEDSHLHDEVIKS